MYLTTIEINGESVELQISAWIGDANRLSNLINEKPDSVLWQFVALLWLTYQNACRRKKIPTKLTIDDFDIYVDDQFATREGKTALIELCQRLNAEILAMVDTLSDNDADTEKKSLQIGDQSGNSSLAIAG